MTPIYGHESFETGYQRSDYPYGRLQCNIRFWLEKSPSKGIRFCHRTQNPKTDRWNADKKSTYVKYAACMFLDEKGHTQWSGLTEYSSATDCIDFLQKFPKAIIHPDFKAFAIAHVLYCKNKSEGKVHWTINGVKQETSQSEIDKAKLEIVEWKKVVELLGMTESELTE